MVLLAAIVASWGVLWLGPAALAAVFLAALVGRLLRERPRLRYAALAAVAALGIAYAPEPVRLLGWPLLAWRAGEAGAAERPGRVAFEMEARWGGAAVTVALLGGVAPYWSVLPFAALALAGLHAGAETWIAEGYGLPRGGPAPRVVRAAAVSAAGLLAGLAVLAAGAVVLAIGRLLPALPVWHLRLPLPHAPRAAPVRPLVRIPPGVVPHLHLPWLRPVMNVVSLLLAAALVVFILARLRRRRAEEAPPEWEASEERESVEAQPGRVRRPAAVSRPGAGVRTLFRRWLALARRAGLARLASETPAEHGRRAAPGLDPARRLVRIYERARYGGESGADLEREALAVWRALARDWRAGRGGGRS